MSLKQNTLKIINNAVQRQRHRNTKLNLRISKFIINLKSLAYRGKVKWDLGDI